MRRMRRTFTTLWLGVALAIAMFRFLVARVGLNRADPDSDELRLILIGDGIELKSRASAFRGGGVLCIFGGANLDLSEARFASDETTLRVACAFGGLEIVVPDGCAVSLRNTAVAGGANNRAREGDLPDDAPRLHIEAFTIFGGLDVTRAGE